MANLGYFYEKISNSTGKICRIRQMDTNEVIYLSPVRYPTDKAYGVTIRYTMASLENLGFQIKVIDPQWIINQGYSSVLDVRFTQTLKRLVKSGNFSRSNYNLVRLMVALTARHLFKNQKEILWTRDPLIALMVNLLRRTSNIVIEIHQNPHLIDKILLKVLSRKNRTILAPISLELHNKMKRSRLNFSMQNVVLCPMGVPDEFLKSASPRDKVNYRKVKVAYVGGLRSTGVDQGIKELIKFIIKINLTSDLCQFELKLFGLSEAEENELKTDFLLQIGENVISSERRQVHGDLIPKLLKCDIFLLPYPESDFFNARFPLKALEYAALRRPIVASSTPSHRNIFQNEEVFYFRLGSCEDFHRALLEAAMNEELVSKKIELAFAKATDHSYVNRVLRVINRFSTA